MLKACALAPAVIEVLSNCYPQLQVAESWKAVIPEEVFQVGELPFLPLECRIVVCVCLAVCGVLHSHPGKCIMTDGNGGVYLSASLFLLEVQ